MPKFRKKPVVIEAEQFFTGGKDIPGVTLVAVFAHEHPTGELNAFRPVIETLEGMMSVSEGDWIITGVNGEKYPCKPDIFEKTYEPVA